MDTFIASLLTLVNETIAAAIIVVAASILLYNLTRNLDNRVARTSAVVLGCVTVAYACDVFVSLGPGAGTFQATLRLQWLGIAFMPAALFHLSDALLATTGLPSRGRRRRVIRIFYALGAVFLLLAAFTNRLVQPVLVQPELLERGVYVSLRAGMLFPIYIVFFLFVTGFAFYNVQRARQRCLTRSTRRRMGYLQFAMLTPAVGIFPFSVLLGVGQEYSVIGLSLVNITNLIIIFMLIFLAYPLSFFGSRIPDRVVKAELLRFLLRGPATALLALVVILFLTPTTRILSLPGDELIGFAVVAVVLLWQWFIALALPFLERKLVYVNGDYEQFDQLQNLSERLLTRADLVQLLDATLAASCDYLRVNTAFISAYNADGMGVMEVVSAVGSARPSPHMLNDDPASLPALFASNDTTAVWNGYWVVPLYGMRGATAQNRQTTLIGMMGIQARAAIVDLTPDERDRLKTFARRCAQTLDDMNLQVEIIAALEGLLPQVSITRTTAQAMEYMPRRLATPSQIVSAPQLPSGAESDPFVDKDQFKEQVRAALRHYWGGSGLNSSRLLELQIVRDAMPDNDNNPVRALRAVLKRAIERQRPDGEQKLLSPEWTIYNILQLRFIERAKVRDVARQLALSEPTLFRRQDDAISAIAETLMSIENERPAQPST